MRLTTAAEAVLRRICRRLRAEGARVSVVIASETNAIAVGAWPDGRGDIGLVLDGTARCVQVQTHSRVVNVPLGPHIVERIAAHVVGRREHR